MIKKIISALLLLSIMFSTVAIRAEESEKVLYDESVPFLMNLGIIYDKYQEHDNTHYYLRLGAEEKLAMYESFYPEMEVSRAEFIMFALKLNGVDVESIEKGTTEQKFKDVPVDHWAAGYINYANSTGLISGVGDGNFSPTEPVKVAQALKIIINILGYDNVAKASGGYPNGYYAVANDLGVTKGVNVSLDDNLLKKDMAKFFYNALFVDVLQLTGIAGDFVEQSAIEDENLLYVKFGIIKEKGQVTSTKYTSLVGETKLSKDQVEIDKEVYQLENIDMTDYLGMTVNFYYKDEDGDKTLIYCEPDLKKNSVITVKADDILGDDSEFSTGKFIYLDEKEKRSSERISSKVDVIINGKAEPEYDEADLAPQIGDVKLIDFDGDGVIDVFFVNRYKNTIVASVDVEKGIIYDKYDADRNIEIDKTSYDYDVIIEKNGLEIDASQLAEWDVVAYYESINESGVKLKRLSVSSDSIDGTVNSISDEEITIGNKTYKMSKDFRSDGGTLKLKNEGNFRIDIDGKIVAISEKIQKSGYGYLLNAFVDEDNEPTLHLRVLTKTGAVEKLIATEKIKINDYNINNAEEMYKELVSSGQYEGYATQLIRYETNAEGYINKLYTTKYEDEEAGIKLDILKAKRRYRPGARTFDGKFVMTQNSFIIGMPTVSGEGDVSFKESENYSILKPESFENYEEYMVEAYNVKDALIADVVLVYGDVAEQQISTKSDIAIVDKIGTKLDADDMPVPYIGVWVGGSLQEKILSAQMEQVTINMNVADIFSDIVGDEVSADVVLDDSEDINKAVSMLKRGDVLRFGVNPKGEITRLAIDASLDRKNDYFALYQYHHPLRLYCGAVYDFKDNILALTTDVKNHSDAEAYNVANAQVLIYDKDARKITKGSTKDLSSCIYKYNPDVKVMVRSMEGQTRDVIIVK